MTELYSRYLACDCRVTTDSRGIRGGEIFFALRGENFDGNDYASSALESGAAWAVVNDDAPLGDDPRFIRVKDTLEALRTLAIEHRDAVGIPVIGLTGTNGKTTTKNLISAVLSKRFRVCATEGNLNNDIGVPLSLLKIRPDTQIAVIEMGANHPDDIAKLVQVSRPDYGLITNVGKAHLLGFGSFEGVKAAKGELYKWLGSRNGSLIFLNADDEDLRSMSKGLPCHFFEYGIKYQGAVIQAVTPDNPFLSIKLGDDVINTRLVGSYNATNVLAALCVGDYFGVSRKDAIEAVEAFDPDNKRSQLCRTERNTLILDAYNANPSSMTAALDNFAALQSPGKLALLGDMRELGADSVAEHRRILDKLRTMGVEALLVGEEFAKAAEGSGDFPIFGTSEELAAHLAAHPVSGMVILVKGSRGIQMEKTIPCL